MTTASLEATPADRDNLLLRGQAWLDARGKAGWIVATVLGFIFFWPIGLALLFYMIWSKNMFKSSCNRKSRKKWNAIESRSTGNSAFDAYKADTLRRLEEEQDKFEAFLGRLRDAKDKAEFDQFMDERARENRDEPENGERA